MFITSKGVKINADVNGSLNIFKKAIKNLEQVVQDELISIPLNTGLVMNPIKINLRTENSIEFLSSLIKSLWNKTLSIKSLIFLIDFNSFLHNWKEETYICWKYSS